MSHSRNPKVIVITGASSGIGAALARHYAIRGVTLGLIGRHAERLEQVALNCTSRGAEVEIGLVDVAEPNAIRAWLEEFDDKHAVDLVIANAGVSGGTAVGTEKPEDMERIFAINLGGVINTLQPFIPRMQERGQGQLAIMASLAGFRGFPGAPAYCASKAAARVYGEALRGFLVKDNIDVNVICPGFVTTPMTQINDYHMPFIISAEQAAPIIAKGLAQNKARIAFPLRAYAVMWLIAALPPGLTDWLFAKLPAKSSAGLTR